MNSIGELFVSLGFDIDDKKLKDFNDGLKQTADKMLEIAGISLTAAGFKIWMDSASDAAVRLRNMNAELGLSSNLVQSFASIVHQVNPLISFDKATESLERFSATVKQQIATGGGPSGSLALLLGGAWHPGMGEGEMLEAIRGNKQNVVRQFGGGAYGESKFSGFLNDVGLGSGTTRYFDLKQQEIDLLTRKLTLSQDELDKLSDIDDASAELHNSWRMLSNQIMVHLAPALSDMIRRITEFVNILPHKADQAADGYVGLRNNITDAANKHGWFDAMFIDPFAQILGLRDSSSTNIPGAIGNQAMMFLGAETRGERNNNPGNLRSWGNVPISDGFANFSSPQAGLHALAMQLKLYGARGKDTLSSIISTYAPASDGNDVPAYIKDVMGRTGFGADQHLDLTNPSTLSSLMDAMIRHENKGRDIYGNDVGKAAGLTQNITQNIHANAPLDVTLSEVHRSNQRELNNAYTVTAGSTGSY